MTKSEKEHWEQQRAKGYDRFLLQHGLLKTGLPFGFFMTVGRLLIATFSHQPIAPVWELLIGFGFYTVLFGAGMGKATWQQNEKEYLKPTDNDELI